MIGWLDTNSGFIVSIGVLVGIVAATGVMHRYVLPVTKLIQAQLTVNGGGSLVDKVNRIAPNHEEAKGHWTAIESALVADAARFEKVEEAITGLRTEGYDRSTAIEELRNEARERADAVHKETVETAAALKETVEAAAALKAKR